MSPAGKSKRSRSRRESLRLRESLKRTRNTTNCFSSLNVHEGPHIISNVSGCQRELKPQHRKRFIRRPLRFRTTSSANTKQCCFICFSQCDTDDPCLPQLKMNGVAGSDDDCNQMLTSRFFTLVTRHKKLDLAIDDKEMFAKHFENCFKTKTIPFNMSACKSCLASLIAPFCEHFAEMEKHVLQMNRKLAMIVDRMEGTEKVPQSKKDFYNMVAVGQNCKGRNQIIAEFRKKLIQKTKNNRMSVPFVKLTRCDGDNNQPTNTLVRPKTTIVSRDDNQENEETVQENEIFQNAFLLLPVSSDPPDLIHIDQPVTPESSSNSVSTVSSSSCQTIGITSKVVSIECQTEPESKMYIATETQTDDIVSSPSDNSYLSGDMPLPDIAADIAGKMDTSGQLPSPDTNGNGIPSDIDQSQSDADVGQGNYISNNYQPEQREYEETSIKVEVQNDDTAQDQNNDSYYMPPTDNHGTYHENMETAENEFQDNGQNYTNGYYENVQNGTGDYTHIGGSNVQGEFNQYEYGQNGLGIGQGPRQSPHQQTFQENGQYGSERFHENGPYGHYPQTFQETGQYSQNAENFSGGYHQQSHQEYQNKESTFNDMRHGNPFSSGPSDRNSPPHYFTQGNGQNHFDEPPTHEQSLPPGFTFTKQVIQREQLTVKDPQGNLVNRSYRLLSSQCSSFGESSTGIFQHSNVPENYESQQNFLNSNSTNFNSQTGDFHIRNNFANVGPSYGYNTAAMDQDQDEDYQPYVEISEIIEDTEDEDNNANILQE